MPPADRDLAQDDPLEDFEARELSFLGQTKTVFVSGSGPAVIVMAEMPGIYPHVSRFARWAERFAAYQRALGERFVARVLPESAANREGVGARMKPHSVVTAHLIDRAGEPTRQALDEILGFFRQRLVT